MKNRKKTIFALFALLLLVGVGTYTFARYQSELGGDGKATAAAWSVVLKDGETEFNAEHDVTFTAEGSEYVAEGKIAPTTSVTATITLDASGSEVPVDYVVELGDMTTGFPEGLTLTEVTAGGTSIKSNDAFTGSIALTDVNTPVELVLTLTWDESDDNATDTGFASTEFAVPVKVTATQKVAAGN